MEEYLVVFTDAALDDLEKEVKDKSAIEKIRKILKKELKFSPKTKGIFLGTAKESNLTFYEKRFFFNAGYRAYYTILSQSVVVEMIKYEGTTTVRRISTKKSQKKVLKELGI